MARIDILVGHGEATDGKTYDPGATRFGYEEFQIAKEIAKYCNAKLLQYECNSTLINYDGKLGLNERINKYLSKGSADLIVEIHLNSFAKDNAATGTEVWHYPGDKTGQAVAAQISGDLSKTLGIVNRGAKAAHNQFGIVEKTAPTALLVETAFISTLSDVQKINNAEGQKKAGECIAMSIAKALSLKLKTSTETVTVPPKASAPAVNYTAIIKQKDNEIATLKTTVKALTDKINGAKKALN